MATQQPGEQGRADLVGRVQAAFASPVSVSWQDDALQVLDTRHGGTLLRVWPDTAPRLRFEAWIVADHPDDPALAGLALLALLSSSPMPPPAEAGDFDLDAFRSAPASNRLAPLSWKQRSLGHAIASLCIEVRASNALRPLTRACADFTARALRWPPRAPMPIEGHWHGYPYRFTLSAGTAELRIQEAGQERTATPAWLWTSSVPRTSSGDVSEAYLRRHAAADLAAAAAALDVAAFPWQFPIVDRQGRWLESPEDAMPLIHTVPATTLADARRFLAHSRPSAPGIISDEPLQVDTRRFPERMPDFGVRPGP